MPIVTFCCCGCSLRIGTLIGLFIHAVFVSVCIVVIIWVGLSVQAIDTTEFVPPFAETATTVINVISIVIKVIIAILLSRLVINILGIFGAIKEWSAFLIPFLVFQLISMVVFTIFIIGLAYFGLAIVPNLIIKLHMEVMKDRVVLSIVFIEIVLLLYVVLGVYLLIVVVSFFQELKEDTEENSED